MRQQVLSSPRQEHAVPKGVAIKLDALVERHLAALLAVMALGAALRFSTLTLQSYSLDEAVTVGLLHQSLRGMLAAIPHSEATPPLYYIIAWGWSKLFGTGEIALRSLSALLGTAAIPATYAAARSLISRRGALIAAAFVAVSPLLVWYSQEARAYVLLSLLGALSLLFFVRGLQRGHRALVWWSVVSMLALATLIGSAGAYLLWLLPIANDTAAYTPAERRRGIGRQAASQHAAGWGSPQRLQRCSCCLG